MLVLTRKEGQKLFIGDDIEIQLVSISRGQAKLGVTAPREIPILREEIKKKEVSDEGERETV